tara:strand:+ start:578 stop:880 length:303 start_codon:yes stop_codon:yes gene_type:complete
MNKLHESVRDILERVPDARDCDRALCYVVWNHQMKKHTDLTTDNFITAYLAKNLVSTADSITRARRKLQEVDKTLRGKKWYERHNRAEEYKQEIVNFKYE